MLKFLHFADVHFGMENYGKIDKKTGLHSRLADFCRSFDVIVDYAVKNKIDFVLFAGDAYKTRDPSPTYQREFSKRVKKMAVAGIQVILLVGNHDMPNAAGRANTLDIYSALEVDNVYVSRQPEILKFAKIDDCWQIMKESKTYNLKPKTYFQIVTLPWVLKTQLLAPEEYEKKGVSESYDLMSKKLSEIAQNLASHVDKKYPCVFLGHATVAGAEYGSERKAYFGHDILLPQDILQKGPWQYAALGHLHKYQVLSQNPPTIYSGSIERVDFGEEKEDKGFIVCELNTNEGQIHANNFSLKYNFITLPARKFINISCEVKDEDLDSIQKLIKEIKKFNVKDAAVKINLKIPEEKLPALQEKEIKEVLAGAYYFAGITKEIIKKQREQTLENIESLSVLEALEKYWQSRDFAKKRIGELKGYVQKLLEE